MQRRPLSPSSYARSLVSTCVVQVLALVLLVGASPSVPSLQLKWSAPSECPTLEQVQNDVSGLLSNPPGTGGEPVAADATIQAKRDAGYVLRLTANGQTRVIEGASCQQLAQAAALLLALLVDPARASALSDGASDPPREPGPSPEKPENTAEKGVEAGSGAGSRAAATPNQKPLDRRASSVPVLTLIELGARIEWGSWPKAEPALLAGAGFERGRFRLIGHASLGKSVHLDSRTGGGLDLFVGSLDLVPAYRLVFEQWAFEPGLGAELGFSRASSQGFDPSTRSAYSVSALGTARLSRQIGRVLRGWVEPGVGVPLVRPRWVLLDGELLHRFGPFIRFQMGLEVAF